MKKITKKADTSYIEDPSTITVTLTNLMWLFSLIKNNAIILNNISYPPEVKVNINLYSVRLTRLAPLSAAVLSAGDRCSGGPACSPHWQLACCPAGERIYCRAPSCSAHTASGTLCSRKKNNLCFLLHNDVHNVMSFAAFCRFQKNKVGYWGFRIQF